MHKSLLALAQFGALALTLTLSLALWLYSCLSLLPSLSLSLPTLQLLWRLVCCTFHLSKRVLEFYCRPCWLLCEKGENELRAMIAHLFRLWYIFGKDFPLPHLSLTDSIIICVLNRTDSNQDFSMTESECRLFLCSTGLFIKETKRICSFSMVCRSLWYNLYPLIKIWTIVKGYTRVC